MDVRCDVDCHAGDGRGEMEPVGVFLACGAEPIVPPVPGVNLPHVFTAQDTIRRGLTFPGKRIAVVGTG